MSRSRDRLLLTKGAAELIRERFRRVGERRSRRCLDEGFDRHAAKHFVVAKSCKLILVRRDASGVVELSRFAISNGIRRNAFGVPFTFGVIRWSKLAKRNMLCRPIVNWSIWELGREPRHPIN
jgi:hypothetical protein